MMIAVKKIARRVSGLTSRVTSTSITQTISTKDSIVSYLLMATNSFKCKEQAILNLKVIIPEVLFPNVFTPDGDGINDVFAPFVKQGTIKIEEMSVYNRWGQRVYRSTDANAAWNGTVDGKEAPVDLYVYVVKYRYGDGSLQPIAKGEINLLR